MTESATDKPSKPAKFCDIVMKGGITSGVVYPHALTELAKAFQFRSIGGTSAGAIAAAAAAAAELGRDRGGFAKLSTLPTWLGEPGSGGAGSNLFHLFQPQKATARVFRTLVAGLGKGGAIPRVLRICFAALNEYAIVAFLCAAPGGLLMALASGEAHSTLVIVSFLLGLALFVVGLLVGPLLALLWESTRALPGNGFGLCSGMPGTTGPGAEPLTPWLARYLDDLAGKTDGKPLTFGNLWWPEIPTGSRRADEGFKDRQVNLEMMTTCLTHGRPYRLPFRDDDREQIHENVFYFQRGELEALFPKSIVDFMASCPRESKLAQKWRDQGFLPLPEPWNLPVVVAVRMSLSFPILLSAVRLHAVDRTRVKEEDMIPEPCWFSDGGISSNFPVHFFDSPLPRWPTFGFNLRPKHPDHDVGAYIPKTNNAGLHEWWTRITATGPLGQLGQFLGALLDSMQSWADNSLIRMPGYRDRVAHVSLTDEEGGLNLTMPAELIRALSERGAKAGREFVGRFAMEPPADTVGWQNQRWVRFRTLLASIEETLARVRKSWREPANGDFGYGEWLTHEREQPSYPLSENDLEFAKQALDDLLALAERWENAGFLFQAKSPRQRPELRQRPRT